MGTTEPKSILVIDDDPDFLDFCAIVLESAGYRVYTATNAQAGLQIMHEHCPDLVIVDVMMSYTLNGWSVSRQMAQDPVLCQIPVLMVSAIVNEEDQEIFPSDGRIRIDAFMRKPLNPSDLLQRVSELVHHSQSQ